MSDSGPEDAGPDDATWGDAGPDDAGWGDAEADRRVVRRALRVGGGVAGVAAVGMVAGVLAVGGSGALGLAAVMGAVTVGALVAATWLLLSVLFDLLAGHRPGRHRVRWTVGVVLFAFVSPVFILGALSAAV